MRLGQREASECKKRSSEKQGNRTGGKAIGWYTKTGKAGLLVTSLQTGTGPMSPGHKAGLLKTSAHHACYNKQSCAENGEVAGFGYRGGPRRTNGESTRMRAVAAAPRTNVTDKRITFPVQRCGGGDCRNNHGCQPIRARYRLLTAAQVRQVK